MFQLDDSFLQDVGLGQLPDNQKQAFLQHTYNQLEMRVGERLSEGLSDEQLAEFETFVERSEDNDAKVRTWINVHFPEYASDPIYAQVVERVGEGKDPIVALSEYGSLKWLNLHRPDYRDVVAKVLGEVKQEIVKNRDMILAA